MLNMVNVEQTLVHLPVNFHWERKCSESGSSVLLSLQLELFLKLYCYYRWCDQALKE